MSQQIKLLIVDDHPVFRQGLRDVLETDPRINIVGEAADGEIAIELAYQLSPDVILMDINLPTINGLQVTRRYSTLYAPGLPPIAPKTSPPKPSCAPLSPSTKGCMLWVRRP